MSKCAVLVVLDLDIEVPDCFTTDNFFASVEKVTETRVRKAVEVEAIGLKVKMIRTKYLSMVENG